LKRQDSIAETIADESENEADFGTNKLQKQPIFPAFKKATKSALRLY
jgi:hypothetical protein